MKNIPLCIPSIGDEEIKSVVEVIKSGWMAHGPKNREFEEQFQSYLGVKHAITMNSCTSALHLALVGLGIEGEVIVPSFTFVASVNAILLAGARPVLVDIEEGSRNISPELIEQAITAETEAIMVVHYAGLPAAMPQIIETAQKHNLRIIEDSAECLGGSYNNKQTGSFDIGCFSFFPTKNITTGEGGMLTTNDDDLADRIRALCAHGIDSTTLKREKKTKPWIRIASRIGYNFRMSNFMAAIGVEQMKKIESLNECRRQLSEHYIQHLKHIPSIQFQQVPEGYVHSWQMFTILVPEAVRDRLLHYLRSHGVEASVHFDPPVHLQAPYSALRRSDDLHTTKEVASSIITLPMYPSLTSEDVTYVCGIIDNFSI